MSNTIQATLYCDVDGVINIAAKSAQDTVSKVIFRKLPSVGKHLSPVPLKINWRESMVESLALLPVSFFWLTTWNHQAVNILEPLTGLRSHGVLPYNMKLREFRRQTNKYGILRAHQELNPTPFIWIDDVATRHYNERHWDGAAEHLVIRPISRFGITDDHLEEIKEFLLKFNSK